MGQRRGLVEFIQEISQAMVDSKIHVLDVVDPETKSPVKLVMANTAFLPYHGPSQETKDDGKSSDEIFSKIQKDEVSDESLLFHSSM